MSRLSFYSGEYIARTSPDNRLWMIPTEIVENPSLNPDFRRGDQVLILDPGTRGGGCYHNLAIGSMGIVFEIYDIDRVIVKGFDKMVAAKNPISHSLLEIPSITITQYVWNIDLKKVN